MTVSALGSTSVLEFTNTSSEPLHSIMLSLLDGSLFKHFVSNSDWIGKRTGSDLTFSSLTPLQPGESIKFGIKTDRPVTALGWAVFGKDGDVVRDGSYRPPAPAPEPRDRAEQTARAAPEPRDREAQPPRTVDLEHAAVKLIPSVLRPDSTFRVYGTAFPPGGILDLYLGPQELGSFAAGPDGSFVGTARIPASQARGDAVLSVRDGLGGEVAVGVSVLGRAGGGDGDGGAEAGQPGLALNETAPTVARGQDIDVSGTAAPGSDVIIRITNPSGSAWAEKALSSGGGGAWQATFPTPPSSELGGYTVAASSDGYVAEGGFSMVLSGQISVDAAKARFDPGEPASFTVRAAGGERVGLFLVDGAGRQLHSASLAPAAGGAFTFSYLPEYFERDGTYLLYAFQGRESAVSKFGVGKHPRDLLSFKADGVNYAPGGTLTAALAGGPSDELGFSVVDGAGLAVFEDRVELGPEGTALYGLDLAGLHPGVYSAVVSKGSRQLTSPFSVGLPTGLDLVEENFVHPSHSPGDLLGFFGRADPHTALSMILADPDGVIVNQLDAFSGADGAFSAGRFLIPADAADGAWILRIESGGDAKNLFFDVSSDRTEFYVAASEARPTSIGPFVTIEGGFAAPEQTVQLRILHHESGSGWDLPVFSDMNGDYSIVWFVPGGIGGGAFSVSASDGSGGSAETSFGI